jgi:site-specific recombinase XerC
VTANPFRRGRVYWARIPNPAGSAVQQSLGTSDAETAHDVAAFLRLLNRKREKYAWLLTELAAGRIPVIHAFRAYAGDCLAAFITERARAKNDPALAPLVEKWHTELARRGTPTATERAKYRRQVETLVHAGAVERASQLTADAVRDWLTALDVTAPNRYRAAMSSFCRFLCEARVLSSNPVAAVRASKERKPRDRYLEPAEALALCQAMPTPFRAFHALLIVTAMDVETGLAVEYRDIDRTAMTVRARGTKGHRRDRTCIVYPEWDALWSLVEAHLKAHAGVGAVRVFAGVTYWTQRVALAEALTARSIDDYLTKDHRHTCAVALAKAAHPIQAIATQLGNDPAITARVYARYTPASTRTAPPEVPSPSATISATEGGR